MKLTKRSLLLITMAANVRLTHQFSGAVPSSPEAYMIIEAKLKQSELGRFGIYATKVPSLVEKYGGEYIVLGGKHEPLEGEWGETRIVMHKWPNAESAKQFWNSEEYQELKKVREGTGDFRIMLVEGLDRSDLKGPD